MVLWVPPSSVSFSGGDFSLGVNIGSDSTPCSYHWEYKPMCYVCTCAYHHMDSIKHLNVYVLDGWISAKQKTHPACTISEYKMYYLYGWMKNGYMCKHLTKDGAPQGSSTECRRRRRSSIVMKIWMSVKIWRIIKFREVNDISNYSWICLLNAIWKKQLLSLCNTHCLRHSSSSSALPSNKWGVVVCWLLSVPGTC